LEWRPMGKDHSWLREAGFDVQLVMDHGRLHAPILTRNILAVFFPQYPHWDVSGYDTIIANSGYTAKWVKAYGGAFFQGARWQQQEPPPVD
jgi:hypothetical protein